MTNQEKQNNPHYHSKDKGCELQLYTRYKRDANNYALRCYKCKTHNVLVCRCRWEFGWHYGTETKLFFIATKNN